MPDEVGEKHQLAGLDARERGFNRPVEFLRTASGVQALLRYESLRVQTDEEPTIDAALRRLIRRLHQDGYRQLRSRQSHRDGQYLGSQEAWVEYPDPEPPAPVGLWGLIRSWIGRLRT